MRWCSSRWIALPIVLLMSGSALFAQGARPLEGMWSDPPANPEDYACFFFCTDMSQAHLAALLDDPANDERPFFALRDEAMGYWVREYVVPRMTAAALETFPLDELDDPGYVRCEPWGFARELVAPHQLQIKHQADRIEMRYGEWDERRMVYLDARAVPEDPTPRPLGYSVGHYEGDTLVIETSGVSANMTFWRAKHSDQLKVTERYTRDGDRLLLTATMEDPWALREPLQLKKVWSWAPEQEIYPYVDCKPAGESAAKGNQ